jgi:hypothetical protein
MHSFIEVARVWSRTDFNRFALNKQFSVQNRCGRAVRSTYSIQELLATSEPPLLAPKEGQPTRRRPLRIESGSQDLIVVLTIFGSRPSEHRAKETQRRVKDGPAK